MVDSQLFVTFQLLLKKRAISFVFSPWPYAHTSRFLRRPPGDQLSIAIETPGPKKRAHSSLLIAGLASESKIGKYSLKGKILCSHLRGFSTLSFP